MIQERVYEGQFSRVAKFGLHGCVCRPSKTSSAAFISIALDSLRVGTNSLALGPIWDQNPCFPGLLGLAT